MEGNEGTPAEGEVQVGEHLTTTEVAARLGVARGAVPQRGGVVVNAEGKPVGLVVIPLEAVPGITPEEIAQIKKQVRRMVAARGPIDRNLRYLAHLASGELVDVPLE
jgi:hypothetical protein